MQRPCTNTRHAFQHQSQAFSEDLIPLITFINFIIDVSTSQGQVLISSFYAAIKLKEESSL